MQNTTVYYGGNCPAKTSHEFCDTECGVKIDRRIGRLFLDVIHIKIIHLWLIFHEKRCILSGVFFCGSLSQCSPESFIFRAAESGGWTSGCSPCMRNRSVAWPLCAQDNRSTEKCTLVCPK